MAIEMKIGGYLQTSFIDWPGKIAAVVFTVGCNFRCPFCHNADLVLPEKSAKLSLIDPEVIFSDLKTRLKWLDGVVITGGEPTLQPDLPKFIREIKKLGLGVKLDTNGSNPEVIASLLGKSMLDYVAMDYKGPIGEYEEVTKVQSFPQSGIPPKAATRFKVQRTIKILANQATPFEFRTTVVPGIHDEAVIQKMGRELRSLTVHGFPPSGGTPPKAVARFTIHWYLQNFQPKNCLDPEFMKIKPFTIAMLKKLLAAAKKEFPLAELR